MPELKEPPPPPLYDGHFYDAMPAPPTPACPEHAAVPFVACLGTFLFFASLVWNSVHRLHDVGWSHWFGLITAVPFVNLPVAAVLALLPAKRRKVWDLCEP